MNHLTILRIEGELRLLTIKEIEEKALKLSSYDRALLAERLITSLLTRSFNYIQQTAGMGIQDKKQGDRKVFRPFICFLHDDLPEQFLVL